MGTLEHHALHQYALMYAQYAHSDPTVCLQCPYSVPTVRPICLQSVALLWAQLGAHSAYFVQPTLSSHIGLACWGPTQAD